MYLTGGGLQMDILQQDVVYDTINKCRLVMQDKMSWKDIVVLAIICLLDPHHRLRSTGAAPNIHDPSQVMNMNYGDQQTN